MTGVGARARVDGADLSVTKPRREALGPVALAAVDRIEADAHAVVVVSGRNPWGMVALADTVRPRAAATVGATGVEARIRRFLSRWKSRSPSAPRSC